MDIGALLLDGLGGLVGLFVVRLVVVSVWDAWALGPRWQKRVQKRAATAVPEPDPLEVWAQDKRRTRLKAEGAWVREWFAALDPEEKREIDALHDEMVDESGLGFSMPEGYYKDHRVNFVFGEVRDRIGYLAAGTPEKIRRPKTREQREMEKAVAEANAKAVGAGLGFDWNEAVSGAVMKTGSGMEISADGGVRINYGSLTRSERDAMIADALVPRYDHITTKAANGAVIYPQAYPVGAGKGKPTQEELKRMMLEEQAALSQEYQRRLDAELRIEKYGASGMSNEEFVRLMVEERSWF